MNQPRIDTAPPTLKAWDRFAIEMEVKRRGLNFTEIALDAGLYESACRQALIGRSRPGARAIAAALGIPFEVLFKDIPPYDTMILKEQRRNAKGNNRSTDVAPQGKKAASGGRAAGGC
ncbi:MAG: hypothetical protein CMJ42_03870 [Phyllobacteriaceae bacterium]|nr:hypothetical protein [Phyllobacteriaceae bacterium]MBA92887.1 hypothetical protein [Phyllobacteriaceae bacterium]